MAVYLVQHGRAYTKDENAERPLTDLGKQEVQQTAHILQKAGVKVNRIFHSGKSRAYETADIITIYANENKDIEQIDGLNPTDNVLDFADTLDPSSDNMYVGHLPFMEKLISYLVCEDTDIPVIKFKNGCVICMDKLDDDWFIKWCVYPEIN